MKLVQPIRSREQINEIGELLLEHNEKYFVMWRVGVTTGLRISDILKLQVKDIRGKDRISLVEKKTGKSKNFILNYKTKMLCEDFIERNKLEDEDYLIYSNKKNNGKSKGISRQQAYEVLRIAGDKLGIENFGTHSIRKTFGYFHYKQFNDVALLQNIFNHSAPSVTLRYIGIAQDHIDKTIQELDI